MFLLFVWIHIDQQGIWDIETRKLSRPLMNFLISSSNRFLRRIVFSEHPGIQTLRTSRKP